MTDLTCGCNPARAIRCRFHGNYGTVIVQPSLRERLDRVTVPRSALLLILERYAAGDTSIDAESDRAVEALLSAVEGHQ